VGGVQVGGVHPGHVSAGALAMYLVGAESKEERERGDGLPGVQCVWLHGG